MLLLVWKPSVGFWVKNPERLRTTSVIDINEYGMRLCDCTILFGKD